MSEHTTPETVPSFYERPGIETGTLAYGEGVPFGIERVRNNALGIGGAYGAWGHSYSNTTLPGFVGNRLGEELAPDEILNLSELGFHHRHHIPDLNEADHLELELEVGARLLRAATESSGWDPGDVQGVLIGTSCPVSNDFLAEISRRAGFREDALKVSVHKACDGSMSALNLAINPTLGLTGDVNIAEELYGKRVIFGGIEGLSRFTSHARDKNALQLFGNGMGAIGIVPGENVKLITGRSHENFDEEGLLQVRMFYPHSREIHPGKSLVEILQPDASSICVAGMMHEPKDGLPIVMAGLMGMVKLFVRTGVDVVLDVYQDYQKKVAEMGQPGRLVDVAIAHHANYKINLLKAKNLLREGVQFPAPWLLPDFGNVSAASCAIAFLRQLQQIKPGDHVLFDGFGAGTYYDVMAVSMG